MVKKLITYALVFLLVYGLGIWGHQQIFDHYNVALQFPLHKVYNFNAIFSFVMCAHVLLLTKVKTVADKVGFVYLAGLLLKLLFFGLFFKGILFQEGVQTPFADRLSLLLPTLLFMAIEVFFVSKILGQIQASDI